MPGLVGPELGLWFLEILFSGLLLSSPLTILQLFVFDSLPSELQLGSSEKIFFGPPNHFIDKEGKAQRGGVPCPGSHS